jgi:vanillate O-demethylase monooxygenase subunit
MGSFPDGMKVDRWQVTHYGPPSFVKLDIGSAPVGTPIRQGERGKGVNMWNLNAITPESEKTSHYFFAQAYNFKLGEPWVSDMLAKQITDIFQDDLAMVKAQQKNMDLGPTPSVGLGQDKAWIAMRGIVDRLAREEREKATKAA